MVKRHNNVKIITDIKNQNVSGLCKIASDYESIIEQIIPQIYETESYDKVKRLGYNDIIFTVYKTSMTNDEILKFINKHTLYALTITLRKAFSQNLLLNLKDKNVLIYVHTVNNIEIFHYLISLGVDGIYTDVLSKADVVSLSGE